MQGRSSISSKSSTVVAETVGCSVEEGSGGSVAEKILVCSASGCFVDCSVVSVDCSAIGYSDITSVICSVIICFDCTSVVYIIGCFAVGCCGSLLQMM